MKNELKSLRRKMNRIDKKIVALLEKRFEVSKKIGEYKLKNHLLVEDKKREKEILASRTKNSSLSKNFTRKLFNLIFNESKRIQRNINSSKIKRVF